MDQVGQTSSGLCSTLTKDWVQYLPASSAPKDA